MWAPGANTAKLFIGRNHSDTVQYWNGKIDSAYLEQGRSQSELNLAPAAARHAHDPAPQPTSLLLELLPGSPAPNFNEVPGTLEAHTRCPTTTHLVLVERHGLDRDHGHHRRPGHDRRRGERPHLTTGTQFLWKAFSSRTARPRCPWTA